MQNNAEKCDFSLSAPSHTPLFTKSMANDFSISQEQMRRLLKLIFTFIYNNLKSHRMQEYLQFHLSFGQFSSGSRGMKACTVGGESWLMSAVDSVLW